MAIAVILETRIGRPIEEVFTHLADLDRWPEWLVATGIRAMGRERIGPAVEGEPLAIEQVAAGRASHVSGSVTQVEAPTHLSIAGRDADGVTVEVIARLVPVDARTSVLRWEIRIGLPFRFRVFEGLARPQVERAVAQDIDAFKRRLESVATD